MSLVSNQSPRNHFNQILLQVLFGPCPLLILRSAPSYLTCQSCGSCGDCSGELLCVVSLWRELLTWRPPRVRQRKHSWGAWADQATAGETGGFPTHAKSEISVLAMYTQNMSLPPPKKKKKKNLDYPYCHRDSKQNAQLASPWPRCQDRKTSCP